MNKNKKPKIKCQKLAKGASIIEILIVIVIITIAMSSLFGVTTFSLRVSTSLKETVQANALAQETIEAVRNFRDGTDWNTNGLGSLTVGISYHPQKTVDNPPKWTLSQGQESINGFVRKVVFSDVMRDGNFNIVESGGINDPDTKKATVTVSWKDKNIQIVSYLTNWKQ